MSAPVLVGPSLHGGGPTPPLDLEDLLADIGDRVRAERQARGWTQTELGRRAGMGRVTVRRLENGDASLRCLVRACIALGVPPAVLLAPDARPARSQAGARPGPGAEAGGGRVSLSPKQAEVLREAASGDSLSQVGARLGMDARAVGAVLSRAYQRLGVACLPPDQRRAAAARVAMQHGLFHLPNRTS